MNPESLGQMLEEFLGGSRHAVVLEDGAVLFDLLESKYSIAGEYNKCVLHLWSSERNAVRRVMDTEVRNGNLRLMVQQRGQARPSKLEICRGRDHRTPSARRTARAAYQAHLRRALERHFPDSAIVKLSDAVDLEKSFGPIYTRGILGRGRSAFAVLGVNQYETQASIDAALTLGILWLDAYRHQLDQRIVVEGLKLFLPAGASGLTRERLVHLHSGAAKWHLYEYDERHDSIVEIDFSDRGNIATHLVRCPNETAALERFEDSIHCVLGLLPAAEVAVLSPAEIAFRWRGLEFAHARVIQDASSLKSGQEVVFGIGAEQRVLDDRNVPALQNLVGRLRTTRSPSGSRHQRDLPPRYRDKDAASQERVCVS